jgi:hypothetical protein
MYLYDVYLCIYIHKYLHVYTFIFEYAYIFLRNQNCNIQFLLVNAIIEVQERENVSL